MKNYNDHLKLAIVQLEPVLFDTEASLKKVLDGIKEAAENGAEFIVFPELSIPGYPFGMNFGFSIGRREEYGREDYKRYYNASIVCPGPETEAMGQAAKEANAWVSVGVSERDAVSGTLYNSNLIFNNEGELLSVHRKIKPTGAERLIWGDAQKPEHFFPIEESPWGPTGSLICWETYMPLARVALYDKGVTLYLSPNTNDNSEWHATIQHVAIEGKCFFINADMIITKDSYPKDLASWELDVERLPEMICRGGSCVIDPRGHYLTEPVWDKEAIIYADLDMTETYAMRMEFDPCGHYSRPDILDLKVRDK